MTAQTHADDDGNDDDDTGTAYSEVPPIGPLRLSDEYRDSESWSRSDPQTGEQVDAVAAPNQRHTYLIRVGGGDRHVVRAYRREGTYHTDCSCPARCDDCAHVLALIRRYPQLDVSTVDVAHGPGGEAR